MNGSKRVRPLWALAGGLPLAWLLVTGGLPPPGRTVAPQASAKVADLGPATAPPAVVQGMSFSISRDDGATATGVHPADILGIGGAPLIPCENLGLLCSDESGAVDDLISLSYGDDFGEDDLPALQFSVDDQATGRTGSAVRAESGCAPGQAQADAFQTALDNRNGQVLDGDGAACAGNEGYGLGLAEAALADNLDALARDPCGAVDLNCDGAPEAPIYLTLAADSPSLALIGASPADILVSGLDYTPIIWASGPADLGLAAGDVIDGLCLAEDGDGILGGEDVLVFSLAPNSPTLAQLGAGPSDLLRPGPLRRIVVASKLGLQQSDNVDALACANGVPAGSSEELYLPLIQQQ